jgi:hypothetical protein
MDALTGPVIVLLDFVDHVPTRSLFSSQTETRLECFSRKLAWAMCHQVRMMVLALLKIERSKTV